MNESSVAAKWQLRAVIKHLEPEVPDLPPCRPRHVASSEASEQGLMVMVILDIDVQQDLSKANTTLGRWG